MTNDLSTSCIQDVQARAPIQPVVKTGGMPSAPACVRQFLDLSTGHLRPETREAWSAGMAVDDEAMSLVSATQHGFFVWAGDASEGAEADEGWPQDVADCRRRARAMGCDYLLFDADAEPVAGLPFYDDDGTPSEVSPTEATPRTENIIAKALRNAEAFISGFDDDELQVGIPALLAEIRSALAAFGDAGTLPDAAAGNSDEAAPALTDADLFNCWTGGIEPSMEERARWRGLEVHGVRDVSEPGEDGTAWDACDDADAEMWSVYGLLKEGGCECITDGPAGDRARTMLIAEYLAHRWGLKVEIG